MLYGAIILGLSLVAQPMPNGPANGPAIQNTQKWHMEPSQLVQVIQPEDPLSRKLEQIIEAGSISPDIVEENYGKAFKDAFTCEVFKNPLFGGDFSKKSINHYENFKDALLKFNAGDYETTCEFFESVLEKENYKVFKKALLASNARIDKIERKVFDMYEKTDPEEGKDELLERILKYLEWLNRKKSYLNPEKNITAIVSALDGIGQAYLRLNKLDKALEMYGDLIYLFENKVNDREIELDSHHENYIKVVHASIQYLKEKESYEKKESKPYEKTIQGKRAKNMIKIIYSTYALEFLKLPKFFSDNLNRIMKELKII